MSGEDPWRPVRQFGPWIGGAALLVLVVAAVVILGPQVEGPGKQGETREFTVAASQFAYDPPVIEVEAGTRVVLHLTSADVTHGIEIPEYRVNAQIPPGETVTVTFVADRAGEFEMFCNVFCGTGHPGHRGTLMVV